MNPTLTLADVEYLRQMRANQQNARGGGAAHSRNATGLLSINVVQPKKPVVWPPIPSGIWLIWDAGPNGEADYTDHRYWLRRAYLNNSDGDARTNAPQVKEIAVDSPPSAPQEQFWITAANLAERPAKTGGDDNTDDASKGTHLLAKGTAVDGLRMEIDSGTPIVGRWVFVAPRSSAYFAVKVTQNGGSDGNKTTAASWTYDVSDMAGNKLNGDTPIGQEKPREPGTRTAGSGYGVAFYDGSTLKLWDAGETPGTGGCT